jgi:serine/threonine protein phosphatase 1
MTDFIAAPASLPPGQRIYAIGDVHGCIDQLQALHQAIAEDLAMRPVDQALLVHVGDFVDRGPDSAAVVRLLASGPPLPHVPTINLMGNHEFMMLDAMASTADAAIALWLSNGGADTLHSWGIARQTRPADWAGHVPANELLFLRDLVLMHQEGPYLFVHAGIRPSVPLRRQARQDLLWIREPFLSAKTDFGVVVVHGHTPAREPVVRPNRIGIDTGAVMGGVLTCAILEENRVGFLSN